MMRIVGRCLYALFVIMARVLHAFAPPPPNYKSDRGVTTLLEFPTPTTTRLQLSSSNPSLEDIDWEVTGKRVVAEAKEVGACAWLALSSTWQPSVVQVEDIVRVCDEITALKEEESGASHNAETTSDAEDTAASASLYVRRELELRRRALEFQRYQLLVRLLTQDYDAYVATASFLSPRQIPRKQLPNVEDIPLETLSDLEESSPSDASLNSNGASEAGASASEDNSLLVPDCTLDDMEYQESLLDKVLLSIFRKFVAENTGGVTSNKDGITGLLEQGRTFMMQPGQTPEAQHQMVEDTLGNLMTPVLPPFYRIFMSGIVPSGLGSKWDGKQLGPWFYAPYLTSVVTPTFFAFLVGPSYVNRRRDGARGGLVVEKCRFLQESGCKGLCLHQCKLPAQQFFSDRLGLDLTVKPNFVTQECQWSFGQAPLSPEEDESFPTGCLTGCESRQSIAAGRSPNLCN